MMILFHKMKNFTYIFLLFLSVQQITAQEFTKRDSLQGGLPFERTSYDILNYYLKIKVDIENKSISGFNNIIFTVKAQTPVIQLDLFENMQIDSITFFKYYEESQTWTEEQFSKLTKDDNPTLDFTREHDAVFIEFPYRLDKGTNHMITFYYHGKPLEAKNAPWDGGFIWKEDSNGKPFVGVAVQGTGASLWYPCKDSQSDEPESAIINIEVPKGLVAVSNGRLVKQWDNKGSSNYIWEINNPINNYNITLNIGDYVSMTEEYKNLDLSYYVLRENEEKSKKHFDDDVKPMLDCFQDKFGTYPFMEDGYKLVESPYLGMEHQSAVAYGNQYKKGYLGNDISGSGVGMLFDFIIIHESAHEWFGNSITSKDIADMWIHESFTTYAESVFVECQWGYEKAQQYINGQNRMVENRKPIVGQFGVNFKPKSSDMYYKGALMLNTIRHIINDDAAWWKLLKTFAITYRHKIIEGKDVISFFNRQSGLNLTPIFKQYLEYPNLPILEITQKKKNKVYVRWITDVENFEMPIYNGDKAINISNNWTVLSNIKSVKDLNINTDKTLCTVKKIN